MAITVHSITVANLAGALVGGAAVVSADGSQLAEANRVLMGKLVGIPTVAGGSAGATVVMVFTGLDLPANYSVFGTMNQAGDAAVSAKTNTGFTVTLSPSLSTVTLAAGLLDILIIA